MKPREQWDREDRLDFLDGWHEASDLGFRSQRDPSRPVTKTGNRSHELMTAGAMARTAHREATGL